MENCIFCKVANKEVPSNIVYEDDNFMAIIDVNPQSPGHTQVIPKKHYRWVWDVPNAGEYFEVARKIAKAQQKAFGTEWIMSKIIGEDVHHAHIWIYPAKASLNSETISTSKAFSENAEKIRQNLE